MRIAHSRFFLQLGCLFLLPLSLLSQTEWRTLETSNFRIYYAESDEKLIEEFVRLVESEYRNLQAKLKVPSVTEVKIYLSASDEVFAELTGHLIPDWGEGIADASGNLIVLKSPSLTKNHTHWPKLVRHELIHILVGQTVSSQNPIPTWFHEGIAVYFSYDEEFAGGKAISKALISDSIVPLDEIDDVLRFQREKARLAYEESYSAVLFLVNEFGYEGIVRLLGELKRGQGFEQTFLEVFAVDLFDFELDWYRYIEKKYRWRFLLDFETFLWIFILLIFILVFAAIRIRNRKIMKRWEEEERFLD